MESVPVPAQVKNTKTMKIGTRDSELALKQTNIICDKLKLKHPTISFEIQSMKTLGDKILDVSLSKIGSKALFTKELEVALEMGHVDLVVHSLKDLPTTLPDGLVIGAVCEREDPSDAVILHPKYGKSDLNSLPPQAIVGTSSLRRIAQLKRRYPHLTFESIRGNLNTRLRKLQEDAKYDAIVLATAGITRMGWASQISQCLKYKDCMYAVGQGALAVECRQDDEFTINILSSLIHEDTLFCVTAERALMKTLEGGCSVPLAVNCELKKNCLTLQAGVWSLDGSEQLISSSSQSLETADSITDEHDQVRVAKKPKQSSISYCGLIVPEVFSNQMLHAYTLGLKLAKDLLGKGAKSILDKAKAANALPANVHPSKIEAILNDVKGQQ